MLKTSKDVQKALQWNTCHYGRAFPVLLEFLKLFYTSDFDPEHISIHHFKIFDNIPYQIYLLFIIMEIKPSNAHIIQYID